MERRSKRSMDTPEALKAYVTEQLGEEHCIDRSQSSFVKRSVTYYRAWPGKIRENTKPVTCVSTYDPPAPLRVFFDTVSKRNGQITKFQQMREREHSEGNILQKFSEE
jgi:hypothetical protein